MFLNVKKTDIYILLGGALLLLPIIFFPITTDLAIFIQGGKSIAMGGMPYVDFIDIKPPAIYYIYSLIYSLFGSSEITLRFLDFIIQFATIVLLYFLTKNNSTSTKFSAYAVIIYALSYTSLAHNQTMQIESWVPLLSLSIIYFALIADKRFVHYLFIGILAGIITALKFSMFFIIFILPLADYLSGKYSYKIIFNRFLKTILGFVFVILLALLPFAVPEIRSGFTNVSTYLSAYIQYPPINEVFLRESLKAIGFFFGDKYSLLLTLMLFVGIFFALRDNQAHIGGNGKRLFEISFTLLILLSISVIAEKKFFPYHFSRLYVVFSLFAAFGLLHFIRGLREIIKRNKRHWLSVVLIAFFLLIMSPLPRWFAVLSPTVNYFAATDKYNAYYNRIGAVLLPQQIETAEYIKHNSKPNDKTLVVSVASSIVNYYLGDYAYNKYLLSCFYISQTHIELWRNDAYNFLRKSKYIVLQDNDMNFVANGHYLTSERYFMEDELYGKYFNNHFELVKTIGDFYIYKRIDRLKE